MNLVVNHGKGEMLLVSSLMIQSHDVPWSWMAPEARCYHSLFGVTASIAVMTLGLGCAPTALHQPSFLRHAPAEPTASVQRATTAAGNHTPLHSAGLACTRSTRSDHILCPASVEVSTTKT
jgi:hypothetical protein